MLVTALKGMLAHKLRMLLTGTSIALGVAFLAGTLMLTNSMQRAFDGLFGDVNASSDVVVRTESGVQLSGSDERPPVAPDVLARVRGVDGVAAAEGHVSGYALIVGADGKPIQPSGAPTLGLSVAADPALRAELTVRDGRVPAAPGEVAIDASSARRGELAVGSRTTVLFQDRQRTFTVVGVVGFGDRDDLGGATTAYFDLPTAQRVLGEQGVFDDLRVRGADGVSPTELAARVRAVLPAHTEALTGAAVAEEQSDAAKEGLGFLSVALMGFAGVALFVGAFIIWNTFSMQVAQRTRELALLRAIGATRRQVLRALVAESLLLGLVSSLVGVLLGMGLAGGLGALMAAFGFSLPTAGIRLTSQALVVGVLVGTSVTVVSAIAPARRATKVLPVEALRDAAPQVFRTSRLRILAGLLLVAAGATGLLAALFGGAPAILVALGTVGVVLGVATLAPLLVRPMAAVIGAPLHHPRGAGRAGAAERDAQPAAYRLDRDGPRHRPHHGRGGRGVRRVPEGLVQRRARLHEGGPVRPHPHQPVGGLQPRGHRRGRAGRRCRAHLAERVRDGRDRGLRTGVQLDRPAHGRAGDGPGHGRGRDHRSRGPGDPGPPGRGREARSRGRGHRPRGVPAARAAPTSRSPASTPRRGPSAATT